MTKYVFILIGMFVLIGLIFVGCGGDGGGNPTEPNPTPTSAPTFTGTFRYQHSEIGGDGTTIDIVDLLILTQHGNTITGTRTGTATNSCCSAAFTTTVTGTVDGTNATLTWEAGDGRCDGANGCWVTVNTDGGTFNVTLSNNGGTILFEDGVNWARQ